MSHDVSHDSYPMMPLRRLVLNGLVNLGELVIPMRRLRSISQSADYNRTWTALLASLGVVVGLLLAVAIFIRFCIHVFTPFRRTET
jgi:hypothetical protein